MDTILVVDDDAQFLTLAAEGLERAGFSVRVAESAPQGLRLLEQGAIDAVVLDLFIPDPEGIEALPRLRREYPEVPVIVTSGRASPLTGAQVMGLGAADFLRKPLNFEELGRTLAGAIQQGRGAAPEPQCLVELARLHRGALELSNLIRWETLGGFLRNNALLCERVIDLIAGVLDVEIVFLMLVVEPEGMLRIAHAKGLDPEVQRKTACPVGEGISGRVARTGEPLLIRDLSQDPSLGKGDLHPRHRTTSLMCVPLKVNGKTIGVLNANNKVAGEPFDEQDLALFTAFSSVVSQGFASTPLFDRLASSVDELALTSARLARANRELEARLQAARDQAAQG